MASTSAYAASVRWAVVAPGGMPSSCAGALSAQQMKELVPGLQIQ